MVVMEVDVTEEEDVTSSENGGGARLCSHNVN